MLRPNTWKGRNGADRVPQRCPLCHSRQVVVTRYPDDSRYIECEGCWTVILHLEEGDAEA